MAGNADLWTSSASYNQDIGISLSGGAFPTTAGQPEVWKESGGSAAFSPNAAFVEAALPVTGGGTTYTAKLQWKTNRADPGTIWAGAGPLGSHNYSTTALTVLLVPNPAGAVGVSSTQQHGLSNSDGATWSALDLTNLKLTIPRA